MTSTTTYYAPSFQIYFVASISKRTEQPRLQIKQVKAGDWLQSVVPRNPTGLRALAMGFDTLPILPIVS